jgi:hypothetical protein
MAWGWLPTEALLVLSVLMIGAAGVLLIAVIIGINYMSMRLKEAYNVSFGDGKVWHDNHGTWWEKKDTNPSRTETLDEVWERRCKEDAQAKNETKPKWKQVGANKWVPDEGKTAKQGNQEAEADIDDQDGKIDPFMVKFKSRFSQW